MESEKADRKRKRAEGGATDGGKPRKAKSEGDGKGEKPLWKGKLKGKKSEGPEIAHNHKEQRELKKKRQAFSNPNFAAVTDAKVFWERARAKRCPKLERSELIGKIMELITGKIRDIIQQHDSVRILQCCMQYGTDPFRQTIFDELEPMVLELSKSKFGSFMIPKMLTYGSKDQRTVLIEKFYGHVRKLIKHKIAAPIIAVAYVDFASSAQRQALLQEFYGPDFALFKKSGSQKSLAELLESHPQKKDSIIRHLKDALVPLLEKGICGHHIVHRALLDYLTHADAKGKLDMIDTIIPILAEMIHTRDGARITMKSLWLADVKKRKLIVRGLKPYVGKICMEEYGHLAICALFDTVDDTVLVTKQIVAPILAELEELCDDQYGRKVLLYLLVHRNPKYLVPQLAEVLAAGDGNAHSKKDAIVRQEELRKTVVPALVKYIAENAAEMVSVGASSHLVLETMQAVTVDTAGLGECVAALAAVAATGSIEAAKGGKALESTETSLLGNNVGHRLVQRLLNEKCPIAPQLAAALHSVIKDSAGKWAECNRAAFVLLALLKGPDAKVAKAVSSEVTAAKKTLAKLTGVGTTRLLEFIQGL